MIIAKQMIKTNQISSAGWILSIGKIRKKLWTNQLPSLKWYVKYVIQSENQQNEHRPSASFTFHAKIYLKKPWGQGWVETKLLELKHLLDQKISSNEKPL